MKRLALIIGCPGDRVVLQGVQKDVNNVGAFLMSPNGGSWKANEIAISTPSTAREVLAIVDAARKKTPEYGFVYFSGHGGINQRNNRMVIEIKRGEDVYADSVSIASKELAIFDTCRTYFTPTSPILESRAFASHQDGAELDTSAFFNAALTSCELGRIEMYSSSVNEASNDTSEGGLFTVKLLKYSMGISAITKYRESIDCAACFSAAKKDVESEKREQHPDIQGSTRRRNFFPFAMGVRIPSNPYPIFKSGLFY